MYKILISKNLDFDLPLRQLLEAETPSFLCLSPLPPPLCDVVSGFKLYTELLDQGGGLVNTGICWQSIHPKIFSCLSRQITVKTFLIPTEGLLRFIIYPETLLSLSGCLKINSYIIFKNVLLCKRVISLNTGNVSSVDIIIFRRLAQGISTGQEQGICKTLCL